MASHPRYRHHLVFPGRLRFQSLALRVHSRPHMGPVCRPRPSLARFWPPCSLLLLQQRWSTSGYDAGVPGRMRCSRRKSRSTINWLQLTEPPTPQLGSRSVSCRSTMSTRSSHWQRTPHAPNLSNRSPGARAGRLYSSVHLRPGLPPPIPT